jgi:hypothetical protein
MAATTDEKPFVFEKQPSEKEIIGVNFSRRVPTGVTIVSSSVVAELYGNTADMIAESLGPHLQAINPTLTQKTLSCLLIDGVDGFKYKVTFQITLSDNQVKQEDVYVTIKEK